MTMHKYFISLIAFAVLAGNAIHAQSTGLVVTSSNNVGIGTTSPDGKLEVVGPNADAGNGNEGVRISATGTSDRLDLGTNGTNRYSWIRASRNGVGENNLVLQEYGGNVGIGTTSPGAKLEVIGGSNPFGLIVEGDGVAANARIALRRANAGGVSATGNIDWVGNDNVVGARIGVNDDIGGSMAFKLGGSAQSYTRLFISNVGNVGIGTTSPSTLLYIKKTSVSNPGYNPVIGIGYDDSQVFGGSLGLRVVPGNFRQGLKISSNLNLTLYSPVSGSNPAFQWQTGAPTDDTSDTGTVMTITGQGNVGIGTASPSYKLQVGGTIRAAEIITNSYDWADYVFDKNYKLAPLSEVERTIKAEKHLPGMPSATDVAAHGVSVSEMQAKLLQKIEELTLHQIEQEKLLRAQNQRLDEQSARIEQLEKENTLLRNTH